MAVANYRKEQKENQCAVKIAAEASSGQKSQNWSASKEAEKLPHLMAKFNFNRAKKASVNQKRVRRALSKAHRKVEKLEERNKKMQNKTWKL